MENSVKEKIENLINESEVMLFMKGTPEMPQCGFSAAVVGVLNHLGVNYKTSNVLQDEEIREGIKEYSDWPTIPQLYVKNEWCIACGIHSRVVKVRSTEDKRIRYVSKVRKDMRDEMTGLYRIANERQGADKKFKKTEEQK